MPANTCAAGNPESGVGKGAGLTRVKKLDKGCQGGGEVLTWVRHGTTPGTQNRIKIKSEY